MIYTVGRTQIYLDGFEVCCRLGEPMQKKGKAEDYPGGSVWETFEEAQKYATEGFSVFGVVADWENDTIPSEKGKDWHDLQRDANLIMVCPKCGNPSRWIQSGIPRWTIACRSCKEIISIP